MSDYEDTPGTPPSTRPPLLTPHTPAAPGADFLHFIKFLEESRRCDELRRQREDQERREAEEFRRQEDQERREAEEFRRQEDALRRGEESARFQALLQLMATSRISPDTTTSSGQSTPPLSGSTSDTSVLPPPPQKATAQTPPPLKADATFQMFREWRRRWDDYAVMVDLAKLPQRKQMIQLRMCLTLETQRLLEHTLQIAPSTDKTVSEVLDTLQAHIKGLRNEALRRRELLSCKQLEGESFADFYVRVKRISEEIDVCPGNSPACEETQLKMVILMGIKDSELVQKLISLDPKSSLQDFVTTCRSYEAARCATTAITAPPDQMRAMSTYKKDKKTQDRDKALTTKTSSKPATFCQCCARQHGSSPCPAAQSTCNSCARQGHWSRTAKCPAIKVQCRVARRRRKINTKVVPQATKVPPPTPASIKRRRPAAVVVWDQLLPPPARHHNPSVSPSRTAMSHPAYRCYRTQVLTSQ